MTTGRGIGWSFANDDWPRLRQIIQQLATLKFAYDSIPTFAGLNLTGNLTISAGTLTVTGLGSGVVKSTAGLLSSISAGTPLTNQYLQSAITTGALSFQQIAYADISGTPSLTGFVPYTGATTNLDLGVHTATVANFISTVAIGTQPYACTSTTANTNLNADLLDGNHAAAFQTALSFPLAANLGGTGFASYAIGDMLYADSTTTLAKRVIGTNNYILKSNGTNPVWGQLDLAASPASVTGILPVANGGTGISTLSFGANTQIPYSDGTKFVYSSNLTFNGTLESANNVFGTTSAFIQNISGSNTRFIVRNSTTQTGDSGDAYAPFIIQNSSGGTMMALNRYGGLYCAATAAFGAGIDGSYQFVAASDTNTKTLIGLKGRTSWSTGGFLKCLAGDWTTQKLFIDKNGYIKIGTGDPTVALDVTGAALISTTLGVTGITTLSDKCVFTQVDGNEYIDSLADGYMDYGATTQHRFNNNVKVTGDIESTTTIYNAKGRITADGGYAVLLTAGENLYLGEVVYIATADDTVYKAPTSNEMPVGVVYANATTGNGVWVVVSGRVKVLPESGVTATRGYVMTTSTTEAGRVEQSATVPAITTHMREVGHFLNSGSGNGIASFAIVHFN